MWLLETTVLDRLEKALRNRMVDALPAGTQLQAPVRLSTNDSGATAVIPVEGILTKTFDPFIAMIFGANTAYDDIIAQISTAERDPRILSVQFEIDSPGGNVDGLFDTLAAIGTMTKPRSVSARNALSAAYGIAAAAGNIVATGPGAQFGSIGTAVSMLVSDDIYTLTSTGAPEKRPDPRTEEGRASIIRHLDAIDDLFVGAIADGRGVSAGGVRQNFGRGATLLAGEAERRGMIDGIAGTGLRVVKNGTQATAEGGRDATMDLSTLKAEHPAVYNAVVEIGVQQERERVMAHLQLGESGDMETALKAIKDGSNITQLTYSAHMAAALRRRDVQARHEDEKTVENATNGAAALHDAGSFEKAVTDRFLQLVGNGGIENG